MISMRRTRGVVPGLLLLLTFLSVSFSASSQPPKTAKEYHSEGRGLYERGDYVGARESFLRALAASKGEGKEDYNILSNLGQAELKTNRARDAAEHFSRSLKLLLTTVLTKEDQTKVERLKILLDEAKAQVGTARIRLNRDDDRPAASAEIRVNDTPVGSWPLAMDEVYVEPEKLQRFTASLSASECENAAWEAKFPKGKTLDVPLTLKCHKDPPWKGIAIGTGIAAAAGVVVGVVMLPLHLTNNKQANELWNNLHAKGGESACSFGANEADCEKLERVDFNALAFRNTAITSFVVAGVGAAAFGIALGFHSSKSSPQEGSGGPDKESSELNISFGFDRHGGGAILKGSF